jgi:hypothetical protein
MIVFGGVDNQDGVLADMRAYDPTANTWTELHPTVSTP